MQLGDARHDGKPQPVTAGIAVTAVVQTGEGLEYGLALRFRDTFAVVVYFDPL